MKSLPLSKQKSYGRRGLLLILHGVQTDKRGQTYSCILITPHHPVQDGGSLGVLTELVQLHGEALEVKLKAMAPITTSGFGSGLTFVFSMFTVVIYFFEPWFFHL